MNGQKQSQKQQLKIGFSMLFIVSILYIITAVNAPQKAQTALLSTMDILSLILPILLVVIVLMALINRFVSPKKLASHLGDESGAKGWFIAVISGILSHGPGYVWYPMLSQLRSHGVKEGLIVAFIYARSIKLPWLALLASYFGFAYTLLFIAFTIFGAVIQGMIIQRLLGKAA